MTTNPIPGNSPATPTQPRTRLSEHALREIEAILQKYATKRSAIMPVLYVAQAEYGYLTTQAIDEVAGILDLDPTEVLSIAGFYTLYYTHPVGRYVVQICNDLPCALRGAEQFVTQVQQELGIAPNETTPDGMFTLETVPCIAACDKAPCMQIDLEYYEKLSIEKAREIFAELRSARNYDRL
ncbi:MAG: NADH-quinone oxidoreductase subunit NuoE [Chloroflexi bacterium]|nr:NADH-quinone oxidoreductase subunit NuoE [Chloroflexota bacterium]